MLVLFFIFFYFVVVTQTLDFRLPRSTAEVMMTMNLFTVWEVAFGIVCCARNDVVALNLLDIDGKVNTPRGTRVRRNE